MPTPPQASDLFDPQRHEPLTTTPWSDAAARAAIQRICAAAEDEFDEAQGHWAWHPQDDPPEPGARSFNFYWGASGAVWALRHLSAQGAVAIQRDYTHWIEQYPACMQRESAEEMHGCASYLFGESAPLLLAWQATQRSEYAERLYLVVKSNLHNSPQEPLWGNAGSMLAAIHAAEAMRDEHEAQRWAALLSEATEALLSDMVLDPDTGTWIWHQDLYGRRSRFLGAGHGLAGNAFAALRASRWADAATVATIEQRSLQTLVATALHATLPTPQGAVDLVNWHVLVDPERIAAMLAKGGRPLVQDCHGAPGIICRLAGSPHAPDDMLRAAGELTWHAGPLSKGPSLCHGTAGSAMACLKLWRRWNEPLWLARARQLALHAAEQVEAARARHGQGRHSLWTGDLGVACTLWSCLREVDHFPTLDVF
ncbi:LanC-like protein [Ideonella sp. DXS29W]|uniref:LanC-like protein n=1 Tax=Ideonella lacteola TaxID=2984193 RepID=A0ABU9BUF9_9BURK